MANIAIFRINYKSDFILTLDSDAGWMTPFCIKFWTGAPSQAYFAGYDGTTYTNCSPVEGEPSKLVVQFDDHHLPIGELKLQIGYHFTVEDFPTTVEDEVMNQAAVIIEVDDAPAQVMLDLNGETAPEIEFALPAYANEQQRIANEEQRIENEQARVAAEEARVAAEEARVGEFAQLKTESEAATANANAAAQLATEKAALAQQKADYAKTQGDYAKSQGDIAQADHQRAESDHATATADHTQAASDHSTATADHTQAVSDHTQAAADHTQAAADHTRAESDHTRAESDHAAVEVYVDSLGAFDISAYNATGGVLAKYADLTAALGTGGANIPDTLRKGGMSVKFVQSSDNIYVQFRCTADEFTTDVTKWQGVDKKLIAGSHNLVENNAVYEQIKKLYPFNNVGIIKTYENVTLSFTDNRVITSSGIAESGGVNYKVSQYISVEEGNFIKITASTNFNNYTYAFFDENHNVVLLGDRAADTSSPLILNDNEIIVPQNATYIAVAYLATSGTMSAIGVLSKTSINTEYVFDINHNKTQEEVNDITFEASALANELEEFNKKVFLEERSDAVLQFTGNRVITSSGIAESGGENYKVSQYINVTEIPFVLITANINYRNYIYAFFDENYNVVLLGDRAADTSAATYVTDKQVVVPSNAVYLVVANLATSGVSSEVKFINFEVSTKTVYDEQQGKEQSIINKTVLDFLSSFEKKYSNINLILTGNRVITSSGIAESGGENYKVSQFIPVEEGDIYLLTASINWENYLYAFFDSNYDVVSLGVKAANASSFTTITDKEVIVPTGSVYLVIANFGTADVFVKNFIGYAVPSIYTGKKWVCVGDSLTEVNATSSTKYYNYISNELGFTPVVMGVGGTGYVRGYDANNAFYQRILNCPQDADIVTIFGSGNDLNIAQMPIYDGKTFDEALGDYDDASSNTTICGAINLTLDNYFSINPLTPIGIIAPSAWRYQEPKDNGNMEKYVEKLKKIAEYRMIPFLDLYHCSNLRPDDETNRNALFYQSDGVHPNNAGQKIIASKIREFVLKLII